MPVTQLSDRGYNERTFWGRVTEAISTWRVKHPLVGQIAFALVAIRMTLDCIVSLSRPPSSSNMLLRSEVSLRYSTYAIECGAFTCIALLPK